LLRVDQPNDHTLLVEFDVMKERCSCVTGRWWPDGPGAERGEAVVVVGAAVVP
jgi:hypothetical protein